MKDGINPYANAQGVKEKRAVLSRLSAEAKQLQKQLIAELSASGGDFIVPRVNNILLAMYSGEEDLSWDTFKGWKKRGKTPKKGEKAWVIWSRPRKVEKETEEEKEEYEMFGLAFMFNEKQVA